MKHGLQSTAAELDSDGDRIRLPSSLIALVQNAFNTLVARLFMPVDNSSIVVFRVAFGLVMLWEMNRYISNSWIAAMYIDPPMNFTYTGFEWIKPWPGMLMYAHFYALALLAVFISLGLWYRISASLFFVGFTSLFLMEKGNYLNHLYLVCVISFLLIFIPAHRSFSLDARRRPELRSDSAPAWALVLLVAQFSIVYVYGGLAKLNHNWLQGEPMRMWMAARLDFPILGRWFTQEWMVYVMTYGGMLLDLFVVPLILWPRTRWLGVIALVLFHRMNAEMFMIGIFPTFATAAIILFLPPDLPRRVLSYFQHSYQSRRRRTRPEKVAVANEHVKTSFMQRSLIQRAAVVFVLGFIAIQLLLPLRQHLYPGTPSWTSYGDRFAWRMMLNSKDGDITFSVRHPETGQDWHVDPGDYLSEQQRANMQYHPDMLVQFSHFLADEWQWKGFADVEVRAFAELSLNGREPALVADPNVDLAKQADPFGVADWIVPLDDQERLTVSDRSSGAQE